MHFATKRGFLDCYIFMAKWRDLHFYLTNLATPSCQIWRDWEWGSIPIIWWIFISECKHHYLHYNCQIGWVSNSYKHYKLIKIDRQFPPVYCRADSRFEPSQWEMPLHCNDVSHWLGTNLESALHWHAAGPHFNSLAPGRYYCKSWINHFQIDIKDR